MQKLKIGDSLRIVGYDIRLFVLSLCTMSTIPSCGICKHHCPPAQKDSVRIEYRDRIIHDTTTLEIPKIVEKVVSRDTASHLENPYAMSDAAYTDGFLSHSLESIPQIIKVPYTVEVHDTTVVEVASQVIEKEVEKPLKWHERFKISAFWWLVAGLLVGFRREILKLIKLIIAL